MGQLIPKMALEDIVGLVCRTSKNRAKVIEQALESIPIKDEADRQQWKIKIEEIIDRPGFVLRWKT